MERYWHVACPNFCRPGKSTEVQVVVYGGARKDPSVAQTQFIGMGGLTVLSFGMSLMRITLLSSLAPKIQAPPSMGNYFMLILWAMWVWPIATSIVFSLPHEMLTRGWTPAESL